MTSCTVQAYQGEGKLPILLKVKEVNKERKIINLNRRKGRRQWHEKIVEKSCQKIFLQNAKFGLENADSGKFRHKIDILNTHNLFCWKFAVHVGKYQFSVLTKYIVRLVNLLAL